MTTPAQLPLFKAKASGQPRQAQASPPPRSMAFLPPEPPPSREALLQELVTDWWATLDPRNWKDDGPSDAEVLARYAVTSTEADDWPVVSGSRMYTLVWPTLNTLDTAPEAVLDAVHTAIRLHGPDALKTAREMATWHLQHLVTSGAWHPSAADTFGTLERLSHFLGFPVPSLPELAARLLPRLRLKLEAATLYAQANQLLTDCRLHDAPRQRRRRAPREAEAARRHLDALRQALDRATALLEDPERLPTLPTD